MLAVRICSYFLAIYGHKWDARHQASTVPFFKFQTDNPSSKHDYMLEAIVSNVVSRCECVFTRDHVSEALFQCFPSSPQAVTYRATLQGVRDMTVQQLLQHIEEWVTQGGPISEQLQQLTIDSTCDVTEPECGDMGPRATMGSDDVGTVTYTCVLFVLLVILAVVVV